VRVRMRVRLSELAVVERPFTCVVLTVAGTGGGTVDRCSVEEAVRTVEWERAQQLQRRTAGTAGVTGKLPPQGPVLLIQVVRGEGPDF
jgi:hypothetical protein